MYKYKTEPFKHQRQSLMEGAKPYNFAYLWRWEQVRQRLL